MISLNDIQVSVAELNLPWAGPWQVRCEINGVAPTSGAATLNWDGWTLSGHIDPTRAATFAGATDLWLVGGLGWRTVLAPKYYQRDNLGGVKASTVARDVATTVGLGITVEASADRPLGVYWPRFLESAASVLTRALAAPWWVLPSGETVARTREAPALGAGVEVLDFDMACGDVELYGPRPDAVPINSVLPASFRLPAARRVVHLKAVASGRGQRIIAATEAV